MSKKSNTSIILLVVGGGILTYYLIGKEDPTENHNHIPAEEVPSTEDINNSESALELDKYYKVINGLYTIGQISIDEYFALYSSYERRFYEIVRVE